MPKKNNLKFFIYKNRCTEGVINTDNVLWGGKVVEEVSEKDIETIAIIKYNTKIKNDKRVETTLLPIRDGVSITRKC
jgi:predicted O-methyltransferase YrrM